MGNALTATLDEARANAALIVRAVNAHDDLLLAAKEAAVVIADIVSVAGKEATDSPCLLRLMAAIAKASQP